MRAEPRVLDRLTASDMFLLLWDDYGWLTDIGAIAVLDGAAILDGDGRVRIDAVRRHVESRLPLVPRLRQLLYRPPLGLGWPLWVDSPAVDVARHVRMHALAAQGDEACLLEACQELAGTPLDPSRPLWELWLLPGLEGRRVGAFLRLHHAVADGAAAMAVFGALLDLTPGAQSPTAASWTPAAVPTAGQLLRDNLRRRGHELGSGLAGLAHPRRTIRRARRTLPAWREVLTEERAPRTSLNRPAGTERRLAVVRSHLEVVREIAHLHDAKVNDVVLAAVAGGLRRLLATRGEDVEGLVLRAMVTISRHEEQPAEMRGNMPGWMMVPLAVGEPDTVRRLELVATETAARKHRDRPEAGTGVFRFIAGQRVWYRRFPRQRSVNVVVSNVPGPPVPLYLAGARILELFPMMPVMGNLTLVVAALSYAGQLNLTAVADARHCPDVEVFAQGVREALDDLGDQVRRPAVDAAATRPEGAERTAAIGRVAG